MRNSFNFGEFLADYGGIMGCGNKVNRGFEAENKASRTEIKRIKRIKAAQATVRRFCDVLRGTLRSHVVFRATSSPAKVGSALAARSSAVRVSVHGSRR